MQINFVLSSLLGYCIEKTVRIALQLSNAEFIHVCSSILFARLGAALGAAETIANH